MHHKRTASGVEVTLERVYIQWEQKLDLTCDIAQVSLNSWKCPKHKVNAIVSLYMPSKYQPFVHLGETNLIYCSTGPTEPVFARKKKIIIWILRFWLFKIRLFFIVVEDKVSFLLAQWRRSLVHFTKISTLESSFFNRSLNLKLFLLSRPTDQCLFYHLPVEQ